MDIDQQTASALGFPKPEYMSVERERRWLCREVPREPVLRTEAITELYVAGARLRLREARPIDGGAPRLRLSRKADVDPHTRLITSIYLPEEEFAVCEVTDDPRFTGASLAINGLPKHLRSEFGTAPHAAAHRQTRHTG